MLPGAPIVSLSIAGHAEALAQLGIVLETTRGEQHTGAGTDGAATAVLLDNGADNGRRRR